MCMYWYVLEKTSVRNVRNLLTNLTSLRYVSQTFNMKMQFTSNQKVKLNILQQNIVPNSNPSIMTKLRVTGLLKTGPTPYSENCILPNGDTI